MLSEALPSLSPAVTTVFILDNSVGAARKVVDVSEIHSDDSVAVPETPNPSEVSFVPKFCPTTDTGRAEAPSLAAFVTENAVAKGASKETKLETEPGPTKPTVTAAFLVACVPALTLHWICVFETHTVVSAAVPPRRVA